MKSIKINKQEITIVYKTVEQAQKVHDWLHPTEQRNCTVEGEVLTYDLTNYTINIYYAIKKLLRKTIYDSEDMSCEEYIGDTCDIYSGRLNCHIGGNKVFRITPVNKNGTLGVLDFGVHQYSHFISFILTNNPSEFVFVSDRYHVDAFEHHQLKFEGYFVEGSILIEVGELQF